MYLQQSITLNPFLYNFVNGKLLHNRFLFLVSVLKNLSLKLAKKSKGREVATNAFIFTFRYSFHLSANDNANRMVIIALIWKLIINNSKFDYEQNVRDKKEDDRHESKSM